MKTKAHLNSSGTISEFWQQAFLRLPVDGGGAAGARAEMQQKLNEVKQSLAFQ